jgi:large subunit ribosomal protein L4
MADIRLYDLQGKEKEKLALDGIARKEISPKTFACAIRALFQNWRQGTVKCKTRGELAFSNKKPWRQKGTDRARVSSLRSPLWRKGGVIFGPQPRVRNLAVNKKQKQLVFNNLLFSKLEKSSVCCLDMELDKKTPNTKIANTALKNLGFDKKKVLVFLAFNDDASALSFRNLPNVNVLYFNEPNAFALSNADFWVFFKKDLNLFKEMIAQWN